MTKGTSLAIMDEARQYNSNPNQRMVDKIVFEKHDKENIYSKRNKACEMEVWKQFHRNSGALAVWYWITSNNDSFRFAFSPQAVANDYGVSADVARSGFNKLIEMGYLVETSNNHYVFYEKARTQEELHIMKLARESAQVAKDKIMSNAEKFAREWGMG